MRKYTGIKPMRKDDINLYFCVMCGKEIPQSRAKFGNVVKNYRLYCRKCEKKLR